MGEILSFKILGEKGRVQCFSKTRKALSSSPRGCNEPFKDMWWCPEKKWFSKEPCPFINDRECQNYKKMCGGFL